MTARLILWVVFLKAILAQDFDHKFIRRFTSEDYFRAHRYNFLTCDRGYELDELVSISKIFHGMTGVHKVTDHLADWVDPDEPQTFILHVECPGADETLMQANESGFFRKPYSWLLLDHDSYSTLKTSSSQRGNSSSTGYSHAWYWKLLENLKLTLDSNLILSRRISDNKTQLVGLYKNVKDGSLVRENLAEWTPENGFVMWNTECAAVRRFNLQGTVLSASMVITHEDSLNHMEDMVDKHIDSIPKMGYVMTKHMAAMVNASVQFKVVNSWGNYINGTWNGGMMADLQSGAAELGGTPMFILTERLQVVEYYAMLTPSRGKFIFLSPPLSYSSNIFTLPFDTTVWYCCFGMIVVPSMALYLAIKVESKKNASMADDDKSVRNRRIHNQLQDSLSDILMLNVGAICLQGTVAEPKGPSGRIITLFLYFSYMFLYVSYSACIVALFQSSDTSIRSLKDLLNSPLQAGADDVVYSKFYFQTETEPLRRQIYLKKIAPQGEAPHFLPPDEGIKKVRKGFYAYHVDTSPAYSEIQKTFTEDEKCGLQEIEASFFTETYPWLSMRKHSQYAEILKIGIKKVIERGLQKREQMRIYTKKPICASRGSSFVRIGLMDCFSAFMILVYGLFLSIFIAFGEKFVINRHKRDL